MYRSLIQNSENTYILNVELYVDFGLIYEKSHKIHFIDMKIVVGDQSSLPRTNCSGEP